MKLTNLTDKLISVSVPITVGKYNRLASKWYHVQPTEIIEMDDDVAWRGEAHGLVSINKTNPDVLSEFRILKGIDNELDDVLVDKYGNIANMKETATKEDLVAISGIGNKRADSILTQLKNL